MTADAMVRSNLLNGPRGLRWDAQDMIATQPSVSPRNPAYAAVTHGREAIAHAEDTGCPLWVWNEQVGWVVASTDRAVRIQGETDAAVGGCRANAESALSLYAVTCA